MADRRAKLTAIWDPRNLVKHIYGAFDSSDVMCESCSALAAQNGQQLENDWSSKQSGGISGTQGT